MKNLIKSIIVAILIISCGGENTSTIDSVEKGQKTSESQKANNLVNGAKKLCKIDGKDWGYTKGSGIVTTDRKSGMRSAIFTFSKKLKKGKETIQVEYDIETNEITRVIVNVKRMTKEGKIKGVMYTRLENHKKNYSGNVKNIGSVDVANSAGGKGSAQFVASNPYHDNEPIFDEKYRFVEITDLKFNDVGFSDLAVAKKKLDDLSRKGQ